jgi:glutamate-1-semialdehyde 2,1-aminomutase
MNQPCSYVGGRWPRSSPRALQIRLLPVRAKHPSLRGHARLAQRSASWVPILRVRRPAFFRCATTRPADVQQRRRRLRRLAAFASSAPRTFAMAGSRTASPTSPSRTTTACRSSSATVAQGSSRSVPLVEATAEPGCRISTATGPRPGRRLRRQPVRLRLLQGCIERGVERARELGPVLGPLPPGDRRQRAAAPRDLRAWTRSRSTCPGPRP